MTKLNALKKLLKKNMENLIFNTRIPLLSIEFKGKKFTILDYNEKVIFDDKILNYDATFKSQKEFILKLASKFTTFVKVAEELDKDYLKDLIKIDEVYYTNVTSSGDIYKTSKYIDIDVEDLYEEYTEDRYYDGSWEDYFYDTIDAYVEEIINKFKNKGVRIVSYCDFKSEKAGFYVSANIYKDKICVTYVDNLKKLEGSSSIDEIVNYKNITLYYSLIKDKKEADEAVKIIKELVKWSRLSDYY